MSQLSTYSDASITYPNAGINVSGGHTDLNSQLSHSEMQLVMLDGILSKLCLEHPAAVALNKDLLPIPHIPELPVTSDGCHCTICMHTVKSKCYTCQWIFLVG
ncbi:hypothetical protein [Sporisorium scitamineum]|uniref:Uncharacterized protein n=1 Tax=Sporisorium scitamineum TaxID=49012 RepID=A0A0F7SAK4_9BASI|nr:hypothetical protein [Sporisorium scitamineum]